MSVTSESVECFVRMGGRPSCADEPPAPEVPVGGRLVLHANDSAASEWYGDVCGSGRSGMNTPGGKDGVRMRMYQPRFGLWTVQRSVDVALS